MQRSWFLFLAICLLLMSSCSNSVTDATGKLPDEKITLKVADSVPSTNFISKEGIVYWMNRVKELTDGKVEFEYFPSEQLGKASSLLELTKSNTVDIAYTSYATEEMPLTEVAALPGAIPSSVKGTKMYWKLVDQYLLEESYLSNGVRPMFAVTLPKYQIITTNKKIKRLADIRGLKLRTSGGPIEVATNEIGASPVAMAAPEIYTAIERGTIDGAMLAVTSYQPYQLQKAAKYSTTNANMGSFIATYSINEVVYQKLPYFVQEAMLQAGEETMQHFSTYLDDHVEELTQTFEQEGMDMYELDGETLGNLNEEIQKTWDDWANALEARGYAGHEVLRRFEEIKQNLGN
ncbi:TRAP transporter substrate-binding protein [Virgibacillus salexigens]|uniref:TRAP transporter substrate-binding protein n=1 Tax=Virgibacillus salexigens TaxID=61016 RepID=UPI00190B3F92|nr:TRAP transporter substrate-binding protein DctP [Virgibacillus salexigens]